MFKHPRRFLRKVCLHHFAFDTHLLNFSNFPAVFVSISSVVLNLYKNSICSFGNVVKYPC